MRLIRKLCFRLSYRLTYLQCKHLSTTVRSLSESQKTVDKLSGNQIRFDLKSFPPDRIRNFGVIAHIDHGKSTFSDRLLEMSGLISNEALKPQYLDKLEVERERGITIKAQTASLIFNRNGQSYLLNLIDTPGHVDFSFEVYRSLPVCQGAILLVDATKGVQAQTIAHFNQALLGDVNLIPVINKIDVKEANVKSVEEQLINLFSFSPDEIYKISAKTGEGCDKVVEAIIDKILPPEGAINRPLKGFYFDSWSHQVHGIISLTAILEGKVSVGDKIHSLAGKKSYTIREVGIFFPEETPVETLYAGQVGYLSACVREDSDAKIGDAFIEESNYDELKANNQSIIQTMVNDLPKIPKPKSMVFAGIFPAEPSQAKELKSSLNKLILNDSSVEIETDSSPAFGLGWRLGFLGLLHMDVFTQRLEAEYDAPTVITAPSVSYKVTIKGNKNIKQYGGEILTIKNPIHLPPENIIVRFDEPWIIGTIITPNHFFGPINSLCLSRRAEQIDSSYVDQERILLKYKMPLNEVIIDFYDQLKVITSGYASFDYEELGYVECPIVKVDFLLNGKLIEELSSLVHKNRSYTYAKTVCKKLKENLPPQLFKVAIQGAIGSKIIARETMDALKKDVTAKLYGGDITRAQKLLARQKEGKERLRMIGDIQVERNTFIKILKT